VSRRDAWRHAVRRSHLRAPVKAVLVELSEYMDNDTLGDAYPGPARLARATGYSLVTAKRALKEARERGWIVQTFKGGSRGGKDRHASIYRGAWPNRRQKTNDQLAPVSKRHGSDDEEALTRIRAMRVPVSERYTTVRTTGTRSDAVPPPEAPGTGPASAVIRCALCGGQVEEISARVVLDDGRVAYNACARKVEAEEAEEAKLREEAERWDRERAEARERLPLCDQGCGRRTRSKNLSTCSQCKRAGKADQETGQGTDSGEAA
jgi:hypothetical protein